MPNYSGVWDLKEQGVALKSGLWQQYVEPRVLFGGGNNNQNVIQYVSPSTLGNATDFGDLIVNRQGCSGLASVIRGIFVGTSVSGQMATIDYVTIESCYDGDTCTSNTGEKIRLACIDTPEIRGPRANPEPAKAARDFLNSQVAGKKVSIRRITKDRYERTVGELSKNGTNIQKLMISKGYAKIYEKYSDACPWASNFKGDLSSDFENISVEDEEKTLSCPNYLISEGEKYCL